MRKILMLSFFAAVAFTACKKQEDTVSKVVTVSYPTVKLSTPQFYSFPVGGGPLPNANTIVATAYDSFYRETIKPVVDASKLSSLIPGLYVATISARNSHGFVGYAYVYVAITDVSDTVNIAGKYERRLSGGEKVVVFIDKAANGLYRSSNIAGASSATPDLIVPGYFTMQTSDSLHIYTQPSRLGTFAGENGFYDVSGDTTITYNLINNAHLGSETRVFHKLQ